MFGAQLGVLPKVLTILVFLSFISDFRIALSSKRKKAYNHFETKAGAYVDMCVMLTAVLCICFMLGFEVIQFYNYVIMNVLLCLLYTGFFKVVLQNLVRTKYSSFDKDDKKDKRAVRSANWRRFGLLPLYFIFILFYRNFTITFNDGILENKIAIVGVILVGIRISRSCAKINLRIRDMYKRDWREDDENNIYKN